MFRTFLCFADLYFIIFILVINQLDARNVWRLRNKLIVKQKFCASSWLITKINVSNSSSVHQDGTSSVLIVLASCQQTCMTDTIAVRIVKNS